MFARHRRLRQSDALRQLIQEHQLRSADLVAPLFITEDPSEEKEIPSLPGIRRYREQSLIEKCYQLHKKGVMAVALFPQIAKEKRNNNATESYNPNGLIPKMIRSIKQAIPSLCVMADVALDPFTAHGHDGIANSAGYIDNDTTLAILEKQALCYAAAGCEVIAPSDMMDGRVQHLRSALEREGFHNVAILSYAAKYASSLYGPFRQAISTTLAFGDKKTYQMDPANKKEALREARSDVAEGADMLLIKPALSYLDIIAAVKNEVDIPVGAYHVSGEYAMVMAAAAQGWLDKEKVLYEHLLSIKRAGADFIYTYAVDIIIDQL